MELTEVQNIENFDKRCIQCLSITLLPHENEWICFSCGYKVLCEKMNVQQNNEKKFHH